MIYVKKFSEEDIPLVKSWLDADPEHQALGITIDDLTAPHTEAALICDEDGPVMAARFHAALRVGVQFNPSARLRSARAGAEVAAWFQKLAKEQGMREVIVVPGGKAVRFVERLGFRNFVGKVLGA